MTGFAVEGDLALNEDETDVILVAGARAVEQQIKVGALNWKGFQPYDDDGHGENQRVDLRTVQQRTRDARRHTSNTAAGCGLSSRSGDV